MEMEGRDRREGSLLKRSMMDGLGAGWMFALSSSYSFFFFTLLNASVLSLSFLF